MGADTKIEWATHTFNPWRGCEKIAPGCKNCYAEAMAKRNPKVLGQWGPSGVRIVASESMWQQPVKWNKDAEKLAALHKRHPEIEPYVRPRVFCASMADVFEDWQGQLRTSNGGWAIKQRSHGKLLGYMPCSLRGGADAVTLPDVRARLFSQIDSTPNIDWLLLTKRPENIRKMWGCEQCGDCYGAEQRGISCGSCANTGTIQTRRPNVWLGTSIACQADADKNIPELLKYRDLAPVLFLSIEPLVAPVDLSWYLCSSDGFGPHPIHGFQNGPIHRDDGGSGIDWVIVGGESGPNARPMHPDWVRSIRDQCQAAGVAFFFKQWGEWLPHSQPQYAGAHFSTPGHRFDDDNLASKVGKATAGRQLDGREWNEMPEVAP